MRGGEWCVCWSAAVHRGRGGQTAGGTGTDETNAGRGRPGVSGHHAAHIRGHGTYHAPANDNSRFVSIKVHFKRIKFPSFFCKLEDISIFNKLTNLELKMQKRGVKLNLKPRYFKNER